MPNNKNLRRSYPPITPAPVEPIEPVEELELPEALEESPEEVVEVVEEKPRFKINAGDDMSDIFDSPSEDDEDIQVDDLVTVDEEDVFGEGGEDMSDLTEVDIERDIMGEEWGEPTPNPQPKRRLVRRKPFHRPYTPPAMREMR